MEFNAVRPKIKIIVEKGTHSKLNYLYLTITNKYNQLTIGIYRKLTTTDLIIHNNPFYPYEHKKSAKNYPINRMKTFPITHEVKDQELRTVREIAKSSHHQQIIHPKQKQPCTNNSTRDTEIKMGHLHTLWPRYENNHKAIQEYKHKNSIQN
jgi:hypothetical protein